MQSYKYDKAMPADNRNGGTSTLNNKDHKKVMLICLDLFCLFLGEYILEATICLVVIRAALCLHIVRGRQ